MSFSTSKYIIFFWPQLKQSTRFPFIRLRLYGNLFKAKFHTSFYILFLDQRKQWQNSRLPLIWDYGFFFKNSIGLYGKLSSCLAIGKEAVTSTDTKSVRHFYFEWIPGAILYNSNSQVNKCVEKPSTTQLSVNFFHLCTRFTGGKEPDETKRNKN